MAHTIIPGDRLPLHQEIQAMQLMALPVLHSSFKKSEDTLLCDLMILIVIYHKPKSFLTIQEVLALLEKSASNKWPEPWRGMALENSLNGA